MKMLNWICLTAAALVLSGCNGLSGLLQPADPGVPSVLGNLQGCERTYRGAIGAGVTGSFDIYCRPQAPQTGEPQPTAEAPPSGI